MRDLYAIVLFAMFLYAIHGGAQWQHHHGKEARVLQNVQEYLPMTIRLVVL